MEAAATFFFVLFGQQLLRKKGGGGRKTWCNNFKRFWKLIVSWKYLPNVILVSVKLELAGAACRRYGNLESCPLIIPSIEGQVPIKAASKCTSPSNFIYIHPTHMSVCKDLDFNHSLTHCGWDITQMFGAWMTEPDPAINPSYHICLLLQETDQQQDGGGRSTTLKVLVQGCS